MAFYFMRIHAQINHVLRQIKQILFSVFCASSKRTAAEATETPSDEIFLSPVKIGSKCGYIDKNGKMAIKLQFDDAGIFKEGRGRIKVGDKWGYIDQNGEIVINPQFDDAWDFHEGLARIELGDKYGYIDKSGNIVSNPQFEELLRDSGDFQEGL